VTLPIVLGALAAVYRPQSTPRWSSIGLAMAMIKPTFGFPFAGLLLLRGHWRVAGSAALLCALSSLIAVSVIAANPENRSIFGVAHDNQAVLKADPLVDPSTTHVRIDGLPLLVQGFSLPANAFVEYGWCWVSAMLAGGAVLRHVERDKRGGEEEETRALMLLATITCIYHVVYDALLLACPCVVALRRAWIAERGQERRSLWLLGGLMLLPFVNILWSPIFLTAFTGVVESIVTVPEHIRSGTWTVVATLNSLALVLAFFLCVHRVFRHGKS